MGKINPHILPQQHVFIEQQQMFFVATTGTDTAINLSPKGMDALRIINPNQVVWFNVVGSGNETAAHVLEDARMTIMFCAFGEKPLIVRLYGHATMAYPDDPNYPALADLFPKQTGIRQFFTLQVEATQNSCGFGVPRYDFVGQRQTLVDWLDKKGENGLQKYKKANNRLSINQKNTGLPDN